MFPGMHLSDTDIFQVVMKCDVILSISGHSTLKWCSALKPGTLQFSLVFLGGKGQHIYFVCLACYFWHTPLYKNYNPLLASYTLIT